MRTLAFSLILLASSFQLCAKDKPYYFDVFRMEKPMIYVLCGKKPQMNGSLEEKPFVSLSHLTKISSDAICSLSVYDKSSKIMDGDNESWSGMKFGSFYYSLSTTWAGLTREHFEKGIHVNMLPALEKRPDLKYHHQPVDLKFDTPTTTVISFGSFKVLANKMDIGINTRRKGIMTTHTPFTSSGIITLSVDDSDEYLWVEADIMGQEVRRQISATYTFLPDSARIIGVHRKK
jgi:hypothetical protein